jgi:hypothetical protein
MCYIFHAGSPSLFQLRPTHYSRHGRDFRLRSASGATRRLGRHAGNRCRPSIQTTVVLEDWDHPSLFESTARQGETRTCERGFNH